MDGEAKKEMYELLPRHLYPATCTVLPGQDFDNVKANLQSNGIQYPVVVQPEVAGTASLLCNN